MPRTLTAAVTFVVALFGISIAAHAQGMLGNWITQDHSIVRVYTCGTGTICAQLIHTVEPNSIDDQNPDKQLRNRPICGVQLGNGFSITDDAHARNGRFYDPNTGKTYKADIALEGDLLKVRGYIGVSLFGRTETWHRTDSKMAVCKV